MSSKVQKTLNIFTLAMINVAAIGTVKNWPLTAEYGFAAIFLLLLAALIFFLPISLVAAELATGWSKQGGIYTWVKEAFGHRWGFLAIWLLWVENVVWYPTALSFIGATCAYIFNPALEHNPTYMVGFILLLFWAATFANLLGMRTSAWISTIAVIFGTFLPGLLIISLGLMWYFSGNPLQITLSWQSLIPSMSEPKDWVFFIGILFTLAGMEMSAVHARDVKNPQRDYPRAILLSALVILGLSILGVLSVASVVPQQKISLVSGSLQAFSFFVEAYKLHWLTPFIAGLIAFGVIGSVSTWIIGPSKGLLAAAQQGDLPPFFRKVNGKGMPTSLLIIQALITSILSLLFVLMPTVNSAFWILSVLTAQLYLVMYILMFAAALKLRYTSASVHRPYKIPGGKIGMWLVALVGTLTCLFAIIIGFFPPAQIPTGNLFFYVSFLILGMIVVCLAPSCILLFQKPHWKHLLSHEKG